MEKNTSSPQSDSATLRSVDQVGATLHSKIDSAVQPTHKVVDSAAAAAHKAVDKLASGATVAASSFEEHTRGLKDLPGKSLDATVEYVQTKPLQAIGIALAVGFLLGKVTGGRHY
jgi:ElaB/YqjD/DUF883 family membrane-anchored ribosome-binding protein